MNSTLLSALSALSALFLEKIFYIEISFVFLLRKIC